MEKPVTIPKELLEVGGHYLCDCKYFLVGRWDGYKFQFTSLVDGHYITRLAWPVRDNVKPYLHLNGVE